MECFICGIKGEKITLFSAIMKDGIVIICEKCSIEEEVPIVKRIGDLRLKESEKNQTVYEKLSKMAGLDPEKHKAKTRKEGYVELKKSDQELRKLVEKKNPLSFPNLKQTQSQSQGDLIRNYHWAIFNARRFMKMTQKQLAEAVGEPEASIKLVERGILPNDYGLFIKKLQTYLGITLFKNSLRKDFSLNKSPQKIDVEEKKEEPRVPYWRKLGFLNRNREKRKDNESEQEENYKEDKKGKNADDMDELSQEEMDRIAFEK